MLKDLLLPPVGLFLLIAVGLAVSVRRPRAGRWIIGTALIALWILATPIVANSIARSLIRYPPLDLSRPVDAQAIVILAGGWREGREYGAPAPNDETLQRMTFGAHVARKTRLPVLVTGGTGPSDAPIAEVMKRFLEGTFQVPVTWVERESQNTHQNAMFSQKILAAAGIHRVVLVTTNIHMPRSVEEFRAAGFDVVPAPTIIPTQASLRLREFVPTVEALGRSYIAVYEWAAELARKARRG